MRRIVALGSVSILVLGILAAPAAAARLRCFGERATIVGTNRSEVIVGTPRPTSSSPSAAPTRSAGTTAAT